MSKRRSPSNSVPASAADGGGSHGVLDVTHVQTVARGLFRSIFTVSMGRPVVCSTLTSDARESSNMARFWLRCLIQDIHVVAENLHRHIAADPEMSSLKRNWIGWENS